MKTIFALLLACLMMFSLCACTNTPTPETTTTTTVVTTEPDRGYDVGENYTDENMSLTFVSCNDNWTEYDEFSAPAEGFKYVRLEFAVENVGTNDLFISYFDFTCYVNNVECELAYMGTDDLSATLSAGRQGAGAVYFEIPIETETIEVEYHLNILTSEKLLFIVQ